MERERTADAVRKALVTAGVTGSAVVLSLAAAVPALADGDDEGQGQGKAHGQGQSQGHGHAYGHDETKTDQDGTDADGTDADGTDPAGGGHGNGNGGGKPEGHNPPGNNGTVFIHDVAGDYSPHNVPHVPCNFYADFFGFDRDQQVTVSFAGQAPTGKDTPLQGSWTGTVSDDDAGGAGNDFDLELPFSADDLGVTSLGDPHPKQGYHVKMTVLTNEPGGKKSKVFWIAPCATPTPEQTGGPAVGGDDTETGSTTPDTPETDDTTETPDTTETGGTEVGGLDETGGTSEAGGMDEAAGAQPDTTTDVLGERLVRSSGETTSPAAADSLPFTGAEIGGLLAAGAIAIGGGAALTIAARRRRTATVSPTD